MIFFDSIAIYALIIACQMNFIYLIIVSVSFIYYYNSQSIINIFGTHIQLLIKVTIFLFVLIKTVMNDIIILFQYLQISMDRLLDLSKNFVAKSENRVAIVTGSLSGIGLGIAHALAKRGFNIILNGLANQAQIDKVSQDFKTKYPKIQAFYIYADLTKPVDCKNFVNQTLAKFGRVDVVVNNAGIQHIDECKNFPEHKWEEVIALNLSSAFYVTKYALPSMIQSGWGRIINISSVHGLVASVNKSAYVSAKHGIVGFTKAVALEYAKKGITSNAICPGWVFTPLIQKQINIISERDKISFDEAYVKLVSEKQPSGKASTTQDLGELAGFLVSQNARQVNGAAWTMDGGWTAQ